MMIFNLCKNFILRKWRKILGGEKMKTLTLRTIQLIDKIFNAEEKDVVKSLLIEECSELSEYEHMAERIHFAIIKLSDGNTDTLLWAIQAAKGDYRDVLMWSGFGENVEEHNIWANTIL
jgi:hypothetical protein